VLGHLRTLIPGQRATQSLRQRDDLFDDRVTDCVSTVPETGDPFLTLVRPRALSSASELPVKCVTLTGCPSARSSSATAPQASGANQAPGTSTIPVGDLFWAGPIRPPCRLIEDLVQSSPVKEALEHATDSVTCSVPPCSGPRRPWSRSRVHSPSTQVHHGRGPNRLVRLTKRLESQWPSTLSARQVKSGCSSPISTRSTTVRGRGGSGRTRRHATLGECVIHSR
jgi:hypothetical protein